MHRSSTSHRPGPSRNAGTCGHGRRQDEMTVGLELYWVQRHVDAHAHGQPEHHRPPSRSEGAACQRLRRPGRSRGVTHSPKRTCRLLQELEDAAPSKQQLRDARCPEAFSVVAAARRRPTTGDRGRIGQGGYRLRRLTSGGRDPATAGSISSSLCGWSSRGAAAQVLRCAVLQRRLPARRRECGTQRRDDAEAGH
jgi:hypothetical protein